MRKVLFLIALILLYEASNGQCDINCPSNIVTISPDGQCGKAVTYSLPTISNCGGTISGNQLFNYTGNVQNFTIPTGVTSIKIKAWGAEGGTAANNSNWCTNWQSLGGNGGYAEGILTVIPGQVLQIYVGGTGGSGPAG